MRIAKLVRKVDDLAEALIFDVMLATPRRRWVAAGLAACAGVALYALSGLLVPTKTYAESQTLSCEPVLDDKAFHAGSGAYILVAQEGTIARGDAAKLDADLAANDAAVHRMVSRMAGGPVTFPEQPSFKVMRQAGHLLIARGVRAQLRGAEHAAVQDWIASARLARSVARGKQGRGVLIDAMVGVAMERCSIKAMARHARSGAMSARMAARVLDDLAARDVEPVSVVMQREQEWVQDVLRRWADDGAWPEGGVDAWPLKLWLPVTAGGRRDMRTQLEPLIQDVYLRLEHHAHGSEGEGAWKSACAPLCETCARKDAGVAMLAHGAWAVFSRESAARHIALGLAMTALPNLHAVYQRYERRELEVVELRQLCQSVIAGVPPASVPVLPIEPWKARTR